MNGIYIHIPFCRKKCNYCNFISGRFDGKEEYVKSMIQQIKHSEKFFKKADTIYFGGGTPSYIEISYIEKILNEIEKSYDTDGIIESTIEINPESFNSKKMKSYIDLGFNRFSLGVQSFDENVLKYLGRIAHRKDIINSLDIMDSFDVNYSIDLIWGIKGCSLSIDEIKNYNMKHISTYLLSIEKGSMFYEMNEQEKNEDEIYAEYEMLIGKLNEEGFKRYEVSNFCRQGKKSIHNGIYWDIDSKYAGYGVSSSSYDGINRYTSAENYYEYIKNPIKNDVEFIDEKKRHYERIMLSLRTIKGIKDADVVKRLNQNRLDEFIKQGFMNNDNGRIYLTDKGFLIMNYIILSLI